MSQLLEDPNFSQGCLSHLLVFVAFLEFLDCHYLTSFAMTSFHDDTVGSFANHSKTLVVFHLVVFVFAQDFSCVLQRHLSVASL